MDIFTSILGFVLDGLEDFIFPGVLFSFFIVAKRMTVINSGTPAKSYLWGIGFVLVLAFVGSDVWSQCKYTDSITGWTDYGHCPDYEYPSIENVQAGIEWFVWFLPPTLIGIYSGLNDKRVN